MVPTTYSDQNQFMTIVHVGLNRKKEIGELRTFYFSVFRKYFKTKKMQLGIEEMRNGCKA